MRIVFLGDIVGAPGRQGVVSAIAKIREDHSPDFVIANAENIRSGSGITEELYRQLRDATIDGVTLGDHALRDRRAIPLVERKGEPILIPCNLPRRAPGKRFFKLEYRRDSGSTIPVYVITVLGRVFMNGPSDEPFGAIDRMIDELPVGDRIIIIEAHMEATSEKIALGHYLDGRVAAVIGSHTHVPTADARVLGQGTAFITDVGMCGPYDSVIGRLKEAVVSHMSTSLPSQFDVAEKDVRICGCVVEIDPASGKAVSIERIEYLHPSR